MTEQKELWELPPGSKIRGKHYVEPRCHAARPGSGPAGETCKSCEHCCRIQYAKTYYKCWLGKARWTSSRKTDVRLSDAACAMWEKEVEP